MNNQLYLITQFSRLANKTAVDYDRRATAFNATQQAWEATPHCPAAKNRPASAAPSPERQQKHERRAHRPKRQRRTRFETPEQRTPSDIEKYAAKSPAAKEQNNAQPNHAVH